MKARLFFICFSILIWGSSYSNNIEVNNISLENLNEAEGWVQVEFDISWENSWRVSVGPSNWDAAWVFIRYRANNGNWTRVLLNQLNSVSPAGTEIRVSPDNVGAIIQRDTDGTGDLNLTDVRLRWDYGSVNTSDILDIQVYAIEMVYVPEGSFFVGGTTGDEIDKFYDPPSTNQSYEVTSENAITVSNSDGNLYYQNTVNGGDQLGPIPAEYPKGFQAFYCMKYEVSQAQWVAFFNSLTENQKLGNDITDAQGKNSDDEFIRNGISWTGGTASATTTNPDVAMNYIRSGRVIAYLDWSGLRPMTELEFEKACRGPIAAKPGEFAWGNANIASTPYEVSNVGETNEIITNPEENTGNATYQETNGLTGGPKRVGIHAASAITKNREETGGSYYGIMELTGNVYERCVSVGNPRGRQFDGQHGNGIIATDGGSTVPNWPLDGGDGFGYRGGSYPNSTQFLQVSDRNDAANTFSGTNGRIGFRGVRTDF